MVRGQRIASSQPASRHNAREVSMKTRANKTQHPESRIDPLLDAENDEFDFSHARRGGHNELYLRAQGQFFEVSDEEHLRRRARAGRRTPSAR